MEEQVEYQPEESIGPQVEIDDWRAQEMYNMAPDAIMDELLGLSEEILGAKTEWEETKFELRQAQERVKLMEAQVLQAALDSDDKDVADQVKGKNAEERKRKADVYLADHLTIKQLMFEIKPLEAAESTTRLAMEALLDRQKNLHQWGRMFEAQVKLLSTVRMPESGGVFSCLYFGKEGRPPVKVTVGPEVRASVVHQRALRQGYEEIDEIVYAEMMVAYRGPVLAELDGVPVTIERKPDLTLGELVQALANAYREPVEERVGVRHLYAQIIRTFASEPESAIHPAISSVWDEARVWMQWWSAEAVGPPPVDTSALVEKIVQISKPIQAPPDLEPVLEDAMEAAGVEIPVETLASTDEGVILRFAQMPGNKIHPGVSVVYDKAQEWADWFADGQRGDSPMDTAELAHTIREVWAGRPTHKLKPMTPVETSDVDELFPPDVTIPPSLGVSEEESVAMKAAIARAEKVDESPGPSL